MKSGLALVGACAALSIVLPPLAGVLNAVGSVTLLALGGYSAYRAWAWLESVVEASRRPTTVRRNLGKTDSGIERPPSQARSRAPVKAPIEAEPVAMEERDFRWSRRLGASPALAERSRDR